MFVRFKAQVTEQRLEERQELEEKARNLLEKFKSLCNSLGGRHEVKEHPTLYSLTCILPEKRDIAVDIWSQKDKAYLTIDGVWVFEDVPMDKSWAFHTAGKDTFVSVSGSLTPKASSVHGYVVSDKFTVLIDKNYRFMRIAVPGV